MARVSSSEIEDQARHLVGGAVPSDCHLAVHLLDERAICRVHIGVG